MSKFYINYPDSQYIILQDGSVARILKPTKIHNQTYINLIMNKKMKRVNVKDLVELYNKLNEGNQN